MALTNKPSNAPAEGQAQSAALIATPTHIEIPDRGASSDDELLSPFGMEEHPTGGFHGLLEVIEAVTGTLPGSHCEAEAGLVTVDVPGGGWLAALEFARDTLGCGFFD